ncbi:alpha/beta fold hydrolase [Bosea caraganae]|uniref:Alpha/beta fold hydrolase n=1 Tax=Bosea caraganae TaxID=2763117 RepID=A0A370LA82_9HYPH|nr:alpha/beta fold hydrolase [Bosea caraganae]RDJ21757.1 alpha/beta fold hydrolase [Bosea caraganae]RDJ28212.1 alpha/beta fold hydrolase [Bosea caraganae]
MSGPALRLIRPLVHMSSLVAPRAAGHIAFRLFCTPPRRKQRTAQNGSAVKSAQGRLAAAERHAIPYPCGSVTAYVFEPEGAAEFETPAPTVLLLHGWTSEAAFMTAFVAPLTGAGFRVVAYDLPAHGNSTGSELNLPLGVASLAAVARAFAPIHAIVSHSFGGAIALAAMARSVPGQPEVTASRLAMIAAPSSMTQITRQFGATIGLGRRGQAALERRIHVVAGAPVETFEGRDQLETIGLPTLLIHCRDDRELEFRHAEALAKAGPFVTLEPVKGLGHRRILQARAVVESVTRFVIG